MSSPLNHGDIYFFGEQAKMNGIYLVINAGNTFVTLATFKGHRMNFLSRSLTSSLSPDLKFGPEFLESRPELAFISSVVPWIDKTLTKLAANLTGVPPIWITPSSNTGIEIEYSPKDSLGSDRLANAVAARTIFPHCPVITVDIGTAINVDCVTADARYVGGMITPGPGMAAMALKEFTGKLPLVELNQTLGETIGRDTKSCINSGIILGTAGLIDRLIEECKESVGKSAKVIATGGGARLVLDFCRNIDTHDPYLTLKGIYYIGLKNLN